MIRMANPHYYPVNKTQKQRKFPRPGWDLGWGTLLAFAFGLQNQKNEKVGQIVSFLKSPDRFNHVSPCNTTVMHITTYFRCYLKLGAWQESLEGVQEQSITQILRCYKQATDYHNNWYKAWHSWAYMNFETVLFYKTETAHISNQANRTDKTNDIIRYTVLAVEGFFR